MEKAGSNPGFFICQRLTLCQFLLVFLIFDLCAFENSAFVRIFLTLLLLASVNCKALFWRDASQSMGGAFDGENRFLEATVSYKAKMPLNPLSQNVLSKDFRTRIRELRIESQNASPGKEIASFEGWVLNQTAFVSAGMLILIRGKSDSLGGYEGRDVVIVQLSDGKVRTAVPEGEPILAAVPSPDGRFLGVIRSPIPDASPGELRIEFYDFAQKKISSAVLPWGTASVPLHAWSKDSSRIYLAQDAGVKSVEVSGTVSDARSYPRCFMPSRVIPDTSAAGLRFVRMSESDVRIEPVDGFLRFEEVPLADRIDLIGQGCPG
jgi:hypothetical protein